MKGLPQNEEDDDDDARDDCEPLVDLTQALTLHSKRTERLRRRQQKNQKNKGSQPQWAMRGFLDLPYELMFSIITILRPRDVFALRRVCKPLRSFILGDEDRIAASIVSLRYSILAKCIRRPVLLEDVDPAAHPALLNPLRTEIQTIRKKPYQHVQSPDMSLTCTCLTCLLRWNSLCLVLDFAHWQDHLDKYEPLPPIPRGTNPPWNLELLARNADIVIQAVKSPLWHARILEAHLDATTRAIRRHRRNKGNRRHRFHLSEADERAGTDLFLEGEGPPTYDFPFHRDNYYMLEAYLPNRSWIKDQKQWVYLPADQHDKDVGMAIRWEAWRRSRQLVKF